MVIGSEIIHYEILSSTNSEASRLISSGETEEGMVIYTDFQTSGRGQAGNTWISEKGKNLLISIILYPESVPASEQFLISMAISLGICDLLDTIIRSASVKWPNDIYAGNDKIAGMLIENSLSGETIRSCVAGIGININQILFPSDIPNPTSLKRLTGNESDIRDILGKLLIRLDTRYRELLYGDREDLKREYVSRLYRYGEWSNYETSGKRFEGKIIGIDSDGGLIVEEKQGKRRSYLFKEIEYIPD